MNHLPAPVRWLYSLEWRRGFFDWARSDGVTWVHIFKVLMPPIIPRTRAHSQTAPATQ